MKSDIKGKFVACTLHKNKNCFFFWELLCLWHD